MWFGESLDNDHLRHVARLFAEVETVANVGTWDWDPKEPYASWSPQLYRMYGLDPKDHAPSYQDYLTRVHPDDRARVMAATDAVFKDHKAYSHDERIFRPDGTMRYLHTWAHAQVDKDGNLERLVGVCQDITERVEREAELERSRRALEQAETLSALGTLVAGVGHEIRTPLTFIQVNRGLIALKIQELQRGNPDKDWADAMEKALAGIGEGVERIDRQVRQLRRFVRPELSLALVNPDEVVGAAVRIFQATRTDGMRLHLESGAASRVVMDAQQVQQIVLNLLTNAYDAKADGEVELVTRAANDGVEIVVSDQGPPIPEDVQKRMFSPFFTTKSHGTGLGLSIARRIAEAHGGWLRFQSGEHGTTFTLHLPREPPESIPRPVGASAA